MTDYSALYQAAGKLYNVDPRLLAAVAQTESSGNPDAASPAGAQGLMQLMPATAQALGVKDPTDPAQAIPAAAQLLSQNLDRYGNVPDALKAYNGGTDQSRWNNPETQAYVGKVASAYGAIGQPSPQPSGGAQLAQSGASDVPLTTPGSAAFNKMFPDLAASSASGQQSPSASAFSRLFPDLASGQPAQPASPPSTPATESAPATVLGQAGAGFVRGLNDVGNTLDNASAWIDRNVPGAQALDSAVHNATGGVVGATPQSTQQLLAGNAADRAAYQQQSGDSLPAGLGRIAGNIVATAPALAAAAPIAGAAVDASGITGALGAVGNAVRSIPLVGRAIPAIAQAAGTGAAVGGRRWRAGVRGNGQTIGQGAVQGAETGAVLGPVLGGAGSALGSIGRALTGGSMDGANQNLAQLAVQKYGIPLTGDQLSSNTAVKFAGSAAQALGASAPVAEQQQAFTRAVSHTFGADSDTLTPDVMQAAKDKLGQAFDNIASKTTITADDGLTNDLIDIQKGAGGLTDQEQIPIDRQINNVLNAVGPDGTISGQQYQSLTKKGTPLYVAMNNSNPNISQAAGAVKDALDSAMQRSLAASGQSDLAGELQQTRLSYKNLMTVAPLAAKAEASGGVINPTLLQGAVQTSFKNRAFQGAGDLGELASIGQTLLKQPPSSGTAERLVGVERIGHAAAGVGAMLSGHPMEAAAVMGSMGGQYVGAKALRSYLDNPRLVDAIINRSAPSSQQVAPGLISQSVQNLLATPGFGATQTLTPSTMRLLQGPNQNQ